MPFDPSLGNLSRLPPEIRFQIWDHLSLYAIQYGATDPVSPISKQPRLAFLQTSRWIHDEVSTHFYKDVVLRFQVFPKYQYRSWLTVQSNADTRWHLQDLDDAVSRGFGKLPYEKLKGIQVEIDAPCRRDPGQIVCLWKKCLDLAGLLEQADRGLPNLEIHLKDSTSAKWSVDGEPQKSVAVDRVRSDPPQDSVIDRWNDPADILDEDYEIVLTAFQRLRNVQTPKVYLPEDMACGDNNLAYNMETLLVQTEAFGTFLDADDPWNDRNIREAQDQMFMDLELELDLLPGFTANMMRLERFSSWYTDGLGSESKYERDLERVLTTRGNRYYYYYKPKHILKRYAAMWFFNPGSLFHQCEALESQYEIPDSFASTDAEKIQEAFDLGVTEEEWDRTTWHNGFYPDGIPPFDSVKYFMKMHTSFNGDLSTKYKQEFNDKLMGWVGDDNR